MNRAQVQQEALDALLIRPGGTVVLDTGTGKTKVAIDFIKQSEYKYVMILVPRIILKQNWLDELSKWGIKPHNGWMDSFYYQDNKGDTHIVVITIDTIQGLYKSVFSRIEETLFIADEIHTMASNSYSQFFYANKGACIVGLTATPEEYKAEKKKFYNEISPIIYSYKNAANDQIINNRRYFILRTDLSNVPVQIEGFSQPISEAKALEIFNQRIISTGAAIQEYFDQHWIVNGNYFNSASYWCWQKHGTDEQKKLGWPYLKAVSERKAFLLNQNTTATLSRQILKHPDFPYPGTLVFSNQISQIEKIIRPEYVVHSKKRKKENDEIVAEFNSGRIGVIGSCESLEMGMNFKRAKIALFESYVGSHTKASQKMGRTDRLPINEEAIIIILYVNNSPYDGWYRKSGFPDFGDPRVLQYTNVESLIKAVNYHVKTESVQL